MLQKFSHKCPPLFTMQEVGTHFLSTRHAIIPYADKNSYRTQVKKLDQETCHIYIFYFLGHSFSLQSVFCFLLLIFQRIFSIIRKFLYLLATYKIQKYNYLHCHQILLLTWSFKKTSTASDNMIDFVYLQWLNANTQILRKLEKSDFVTALIIRCLVCLD